MTRPDEDLIEHILEASGHLAEIVEAGRADFNANWLLRSAAERQLEIIGEAAGNLSELLRARHPDLPISEARAMRNVIAHDYDNLDHDLVWTTISTSVPRFATALSAISHHPAIEPGPEPPDI